MERKGAHQGCTAQDCTHFLTGAEQQPYGAWTSCMSPASTWVKAYCLTAAKGKVFPAQERKQCQGSQSQCSSQWQAVQSLDTGTRDPLLGEKPVEVPSKKKKKTSTAARTRILPNKGDRRTLLCYGLVKSSCCCILLILLRHTMLQWGYMNWHPSHFSGYRTGSVHSPQNKWGFHNA